LILEVILTNLREHSKLLQDVSWFKAPIQRRPLSFASGLLQILERLRWPPPQVTEHGAHLCQMLQPPLTYKVNISIYIRIGG